MSGALSVISISEHLNLLLQRQDLSAQQMTDLMQQIMSGQLTSAQIAAVLIALRMKGESVTEITAAARVMRALCTPVKSSTDYLVDTCGTGGDGLKTFNISTTSSLVAAAGGARVAKHGNRSVSSRSGSADVLQAAGVNVQLNAEQVARCIDVLGVGFLFAPHHHQAMKHAIGPRKELGVYTLFNLLGPLTNPANAPNQLLGVYDKRSLLPMAQVLRELGSRHVMVVHAQVGLDEISPSGITYVAELKQGEITQYELTPEQFGLTSLPLAAIQVASVEESLTMMQGVLSYRPVRASQQLDKRQGHHGRARMPVNMTAVNSVLLNAGATLYVAGCAHSLKDGIAMAEDALTAGLAKEKFQNLVEMTQMIANQHCQPPE
jgi:anthranilate phosphoribosyltransferase